MKNKLSIIIINEKTQYNKSFKISKFLLSIYLILTISLISFITIFSFYLWGPTEEIVANEYNAQLEETPIVTLVGDTISVATSLPVSEGIITQGISTEHHAIDIACAYQAEVRALMDGYVIFANELFDYGNMIVISHENGYVSKYAHLDSLSIQENSFVNVGDVIGFAGETGELADGIHLHYEIWQNNRIIDPRTIIKDNYKDVSEKK